MFCNKCGTELPDDATFCSKCGAPVGQAAVEAAPKQKFSGNKVYLLMVIAMFVSAITESWIAMALLFAVELFFVKDKWLLRNSVQPLGVGAMLVLCRWLTDLLSQTALVTFIPAGAGRVFRFIFQYAREALIIAAIVFLIIGLVTLFKGETKIPLFSKLGDPFKDEEKAE